MLRIILFSPPKCLKKFRKFNIITKKSTISHDVLNYSYFDQGLLKGLSVLSNDYGSIHFHIDNAISIRLFSNHKIDRVLHALEPR